VFIELSGQPDYSNVQSHSVVIISVIVSLLGGTIFHNNLFTMISPTSLIRLQHVFNLIGRRIVPCYFFSHNHTEMLKWQFNACRQTSLICTYFLDQLADNINTQEGTVIAQAQSWDGMFKDLYHEEYNHAWSYLEVKNSNKSYPSMFVDVARVTFPCVFACNVVNQPDVVYQQYICLAKENIDLRGNEIGFVCTNQVQMDWKTMLTEKEFYTGKTGTEICKDIEKLLNAYSIDLRNFNLNM
jgi:hypothetical protein